MSDFEVRSYKKWQLAEIYGVTIHTLNNWLRAFPDELKSQIGDYVGRMYTPRQVDLIFKHLGPPPTK